MTLSKLCRGESQNDAFEPADSRMELSHYMNDVHARERRHSVGVNKWGSA
jgi:hypothetical protein